MMKRNILSIIIPALLVAGTANAAEVYNKEGNVLDLYGKVEGKHVFSLDGKDKTAEGNGSFGRLGFKGKTQVTDQVTGFGQVEYQIAANESEGNTVTSKVRLAYVGLNFDGMGSIDFGRNNGVVYDTLSYTDQATDFGGPLANPDNFMQGRATGLVTYRNNNFFGLVDDLKFAIQLQDKNERLGSPETSNGSGFGISASYDLPEGVSISGAYSHGHRTNEARGRNTNGKYAETWTGAIKYDAQGIYLAALYGQTHNTIWGLMPAKLADDGKTEYNTTKKTKNVELVAKYLLDFGLQPSIAYINTEATVGDIKGDLYKYVSVGTTYYFNKNLSTYAAYKINMLKKDNTLRQSNADLVSAGLTYQF